jgi:hypothetical protein
MHKPARKMLPGRRLSKQSAATLPQIHEFISVRVKSPGVPPMDYSVVRARGMLEIGQIVTEEWWEAFTEWTL